MVLKVQKGSFWNTAINENLDRDPEQLFLTKMTPPPFRKQNWHRCKEENKFLVLKYSEFGKEQLFTLLFVVFSPRDPSQDDLSRHSITIFAGRTKKMIDDLPKSSEDAEEEAKVQNPNFLSHLHVRMHSVSPIRVSTRCIFLQLLFSGPGSLCCSCCSCFVSNFLRISSSGGVFHVQSV